MNRGTGLKRNVGLKRTPWEPERRPLPKESAKTKRDRPRRRKVSQAVRERDGRCILAERIQEHPDFPPHVCWGDLVPNHRWKASGGGPYVESNMDAVCWAGNQYIEDWPLEAKELGLVL